MAIRGDLEIFRRVKDEEGMIVGDEEMVVDKWKRYFTGLLLVCMWGQERS